MKKRAIQYARASTNRQDQSVEDQLSETARYAKKHGYEIVHEPFVDFARSGVKTNKRRAFHELIMACRIRRT